MSARQYDSISFDGGFVSVGELKRLIAARKSLSAEGAAELLLSDPETRAEYRNDAELVPKNTSVLVKRAPAARGRIPGLSAPSIPGLDDDGGPDEPSGQDDGPDGPADELFGGDLYSATPQEPIVAVDEEKAINELISGSASAWQKELASGRGRGRGRGRGGGRGGGGRDGGGSGRGGGRGDTGSGNVPPPSYRCHRCEQGGHYISDCPTNGDPTFDVKRVRIPVGIPMTRLARDTEGGLMLPNGETGALLPNTAAFMKEMAMLPSVAKAAAPTPLEEPPVPAQPDPIPSPAAEDASAIADKNLSAPVAVPVEVQKPDKGVQPSPTEGEGGKGETGRSPGAEASASNEKPVVAPPPPPPAYLLNYWLGGMDDGLHHVVRVFGVVGMEKGGADGGG
jgi:E3 ubiquitin-protein ligase RBBP6